MTHLLTGVAPDPGLGAMIADVQEYGIVAATHVSAKRTSESLGCSS